MLLVNFCVCVWAHFKVFFKNPTSPNLCVTILRFNFKLHIPMYLFFPVSHLSNLFIFSFSIPCLYF